MTGSALPPRFWKRVRRPVSDMSRTFVRVEDETRRLLVHNPAWPGTESPSGAFILRIDAGSLRVPPIRRFPPACQQGEFDGD
ncbi:hypothetical protein KEM60_02364 [Austwickia sp. TVS 96-490-7B]|nr:hypothetical protein [Austwickia sp. TVS 96-490-7B]